MKLPEHITYRHEDNNTHSLYESYGVIPGKLIRNFKNLSSLEVYAKEHCGAEL